MEDPNKHKPSDGGQEDGEKRKPDDERPGEAKKCGTYGGCEQGDAKKSKSDDSEQDDGKKSECEQDTGQQRKTNSEKREHDVDFYPFSM